MKQRRFDPPPKGDIHMKKLAIALILIIFIAQVLGSLLPIIAKKIHVDPALMSAPVISTIMDTLSILIYCAVIA